MDASQITKLLQKQNTRYINRNQTVDASTLIWQNQIQASKYIKGVKTCDGQQNTNVPTNPCCADQVGVNGVVQNTGTYSFGGSGRTTSLQTGSPQKFLNVLSGASGSASQVYSSESITLQRAGKEFCGVAGTSPAPQNSYVVLPACYCVDTNGPTNSSSSQLSNVTVQGNPSNVPINNQSNPYLPPFDTYYAMKNPSAQCQYPIQDQNQKHFVKECYTRFPNANNGENAVFNPDLNVTNLDPNTKKFYTSPYIQNGQLVPVTPDGAILENIRINNNVDIHNNMGQAQWAIFLDGDNIDFGYSVTTDLLGNIYITGNYSSTTSVTVQNASGSSTFTLPSSAISSMFLIKYNSSGIAQWVSYFNNYTNDSNGFSVTTDSLGNVYITGRYSSTTVVTIQNASGSPTVTLPLTTSTISSMFLIKYNSSGIAQWATYLRVSGSSNVSAIGSSVITDSSGNVYITGYYLSITAVTVQNASSSSMFTLPSSSNSNIYLLKYSPLGTALWTTYIDTSVPYSSEHYSVIKIDSLNNIYLTSYYVSSSPITILNATSTGQTPSLIILPGVQAGHQLNTFIVKYNSLGEAQWATYLDNVFSQSYSLNIDISNNLYITGVYGLSILNIYNADGNTQSISSLTLPNTPNGAVFLIKYI